MDATSSSNPNNATMSDDSTYQGLAAAFELLVTNAFQTPWSFQPRQWDVGFKLYRTLNDEADNPLPDLLIKLATGEGKTAMMWFYVFLRRELGGCHRTVFVCEPMRTLELVDYGLALGFVTVGVDVLPTAGAPKVAPAKGIAENMLMLECAEVEVLVVAWTTLLRKGQKSCASNATMELAIAQTIAAVEAANQEGSSRYMAAMFEALDAHVGARVGAIDPPRASILLNVLVNAEIPMAEGVRAQYRAQHWALYTKLITTIKAEHPEKSENTLIPALMKFCAVSPTQAALFAVMFDEQLPTLVAKRLRNLLAGTAERQVPFVTASATATAHNCSVTRHCTVLTGTDIGRKRRANELDGAAPMATPVQPPNSAKTLQHAVVATTDTEGVSLYETLVTTLSTFMRLIAGQMHHRYFEGHYKFQSLADSVQVKLAQREVLGGKSAMAVVDLVIVEIFRSGIGRRWNPLGTDCNTLWDFEATIALIKSLEGVEFFKEVMKIMGPVLASGGWSAQCLEAVFDEGIKLATTCSDSFKDLFKAANFDSAPQFVWVAVIVTTRAAICGEYDAAVLEVAVYHELVTVFGQLAREHTQLQGEKIVDHLVEVQRQLARVQGDRVLDRATVLSMQKTLAAMTQAEVLDSAVYQSLCEHLCDRLSQLPDYRLPTATERLHNLATPSLVRAIGGCTDTMLGKLSWHRHHVNDHFGVVGAGVPIRLPQPGGVIYIDHPPNDTLVFGLPGTLSYGRHLSEAMIQEGLRAFDGIDAGSMMTTAGLQAAGYFASNYAKMRAVRAPLVDALCAQPPVMQLILGFVLKGESFVASPARNLPAWKEPQQAGPLKQMGRRIQKAQAVERTTPVIRVFPEGGRQGTNAFANFHILIKPCANHEPNAASITQLAGRLTRTSSFAKSSKRPSMLLFHTPTPLDFFDVGGIFDSLGYLSGRQWMHAFCNEVKLFNLANCFLFKNCAPTELQCNLGVGATHIVVSGESTPRPVAVTALVNLVRSCFSCQATDTYYEFTPLPQHLHDSAIHSVKTFRRLSSALRRCRFTQRISDRRTSRALRTLKATAIAAAPVAAAPGHIKANAHAVAVATKIWDACQSRPASAAVDNDHALLLTLRPWAGVILQATNECTKGSAPVGKCEFVMVEGDTYHPFGSVKYRQGAKVRDLRGEANAISLGMYLSTRDDPPL